MYIIFFFLSRLHDLLLSINDKDVTGLTNKEVENIIKFLPKGPVTITAMSPVKDVTGRGVHSQPTALMSSPSSQEEGVIRVKVRIKGYAPR